MLNGCVCVIQDKRGVAGWTEPYQTFIVQEKHLDAASLLVLPEECDKELHQIHEVTVLGEGNLSKRRRRSREDWF